MFLPKSKKGRISKKKAKNRFGRGFFKFIGQGSFKFVEYLIDREK